MLKAKIKEKLLNRRNDVEIDELLDSNGNPVNPEEIKQDIQDLKTNLNSKATVFDTGEDPDVLEGWIEDNISNIKIGDIIVCEPSGANGTVLGVSNNYLSIIFLFGNGVVTYVRYKYDSTEEEWTLDQYEEYQISGTKLYRHELYVNCEGSVTYEFRFITTDATPLSASNLDLAIAYNCLSATEIGGDPTIILSMGMNGTHLNGLGFDPTNSRVLLYTDVPISFNDRVTQL